MWPKATRPQIATACVKNAGLWQWNSDDINDDDCVVRDMSLRSHSR
jgi:hypothetical protein